MNLAYNLTLVDDISSKWQRLVTANELMDALTFLDQLITKFAQVSDLGISWLYCLKGKTYMISEQPREATKCYIRCLKLRPTSFIAWEGLTESLTRLGKIKWANACHAGQRDHMKEDDQLIFKWKDSIESGDSNSARSILSAVRWNIVELQRPQEYKHERLRVYESIVWHTVRNRVCKFFSVN
jgi:tetratricopeptide (TPR) repeat protein